MSITAGGTIAVTGGTAKVFADDGVTVPNGVHLVVPATTDFRLRESATFRYTPPKLQADGTYTRGKYVASYTEPKALTSGKYVNNVIRVEADIHPESTAAEQLDIRKKVAQLLTDSDTDGFWTAGSLS